jgi:hypothetical protein
MQLYECVKYGRFSVFYVLFRINITTYDVISEIPESLLVLF